MLNKSFSANVLKLTSGTVVAQIVPFMLLPVLTRLYTPADFASFEQYLMAVQILSVLATLKYEFAVMQPKSDDDARQMLYFVLLVSVAVSLVVTVVGLFTRDFWVGVLNNPQAAQFVPLVGAGVLLISVHLVCNYWFGRHKSYGFLATTKVLDTSTAEAVKLGVGATPNPGIGLIVGYLFGKVVMTVSYVRRFLGQLPGNAGRPVWQRMTQMASQFDKYPRYTVWGSLLGRSTAWLHILLFSIYFQPVVGFIALARRLAFAPLSVISSSYSQVFYQRISEVDSPDDLRRVYDRSLRPLLIIAAAVVVGVYLLPDGTLDFIFGEEWKGVQPYIEILIFWFAINFVSTSISFILLRLGKQKQMLYLDVLHFVLVIGSIYVGIFLDWSAIDTLKLFTAVQSAYYGFIVLLGRTYLGKYMANQNKNDEGTD